MPPRRGLLSVATEANEPDPANLAAHVSHGGTLYVGPNQVTRTGIKDTVVGRFLNLKHEDLMDADTALGKGASGSVKRRVHKQTGQVFAVKEIKLAGEHHLSEIAKELNTLYPASAEICPYLINFYGAYENDGSVFLALECMDGSMSDCFDEETSQGIPERELALISYQILQGLHFLHKTRHLVHRDIKPNNILFNAKTGRIKITDFGVSCELEKTRGDAQSFVGTVTYMSPERLAGETYKNSVDIWSFGISLIQMATGKHPYDSFGQGTQTEQKFWSLLEHIKTAESPNLPTDRGFSKDSIDFVRECLVKQQEQRADCQDLLVHPWMKKFQPTNPAEGEKIVAAWLQERLAQKKEARATGSSTRMTPAELEAKLDMIKI